MSSIKNIKHKLKRGLALTMKESWDLAEYIKILEQQPNRCDSCIHSEEQDGSNCYECVKGMADNFEARPTDVDCISRAESEDEQNRRCAINYLNELKESTSGYAVNWLDIAIKALEQQPCEDVGEISDGYHTFNQLYHQRAVLFACIVKQNKNKAWKSFKHSDGKYCFDSNGEWFIVGVDTPLGSYTYHYAKEYWDMFDCQELECGKEWDGHTEEDVTRILSLPCIESDVLQSTNWIPISERLPEIHRDVLLSLRSLDIEIGFRAKTKPYFYCQSAENCYIELQNVLAWMPLVEPYKEKSEDDE